MSPPRPSLLYHFPLVHHARAPARPDGRRDEPPSHLLGDRPMVHAQGRATCRPAFNEFIS